MIPRPAQQSTALDVALGLARPLSATPSANELALHHGLSVAKNVWASSTWRTGSALWKRFQVHCEELENEEIPFTKEEAAIAFCDRQSVCEASRHTYAAQLLSIFRRLGEPANLLGTYTVALTAGGATIPTHQAPPATRAQVTTLLLRATNLELKATIFLLWKATARMSDLRNLVKESFLVQNQGRRIIVSWGSTKTTRFNYLQSPHAVTVLDGERPMQIILDRLAELRPGQRFTTVTVSQMNHFLKEMLPAARLTSHSFKHGSVRALMQQVEPGDVTLAQVQQAARHQRLSSTLTYEADPAIRGPALGTQAVTRLL